METVYGINLISSNPKIRRGRPCVQGTTIEVAALAIAKITHQKTPEDLADEYGLTLPQVYAALAYYYTNKPEMDEMIRERYKLAQMMKEQRVGSRTQPVSR